MVRNFYYECYVIRSILGDEERKEGRIFGGSSFGCFLVCAFSCNNRCKSLLCVVSFFLLSRKYFGYDKHSSRRLSNSWRIDRGCFVDKIAPSLFQHSAEQLHQLSIQYDFHQRVRYNGEKCLPIHETLHH